MEQSNRLNHQHMLVRADIKNPPTDPRFVEGWLAGLVEAVGMKILIPPWAVICNTNGNEGITGSVCIETSHAAIHFWDTYFQFDLYSCKSFDPQVVLDMFGVFGPTRISYLMVPRNEHFTAAHGFTAKESHSASQG